MLKRAEKSHFLLVLQISVNQSFTEDINLDAAIKLVKGIKVKFIQDLNID